MNWKLHKKAQAQVTQVIYLEIKIADQNEKERLRFKVLSKPEGKIEGKVRKAKLERTAKNI